MVHTWRIIHQDQLRTQFRPCRQTMAMFTLADDPAAFIQNQTCYCYPGFITMKTHDSFYDFIQTKHFYSSNMKEPCSLNSFLSYGLMGYIWHRGCPNCYPGYTTVCLDVSRCFHSPEKTCPVFVWRFSKICFTWKICFVL